MQNISTALQKPTERLKFYELYKKMSYFYNKSCLYTLKIDVGNSFEGSTR